MLWCWVIHEIFTPINWPLTWTCPPLQFFSLFHSCTFLHSSWNLSLFLLLLTWLFPSLLFSKRRLHPPRFCAPIFRRAKQTVYISLPISSLTHVSSCCISDANRPSVRALIPPHFLQDSFWFGWNSKPFNSFTNREICKTIFPGRILFILQCSSSLRCASLHLFSTAAATSCRSPSWAPPAATATTGGSSTGVWSCWWVGRWEAQFSFLLYARGFLLSWICLFGV